MSYCDVTYADGYFLNRAFSDAWAGDKKLIYLETATQNIKDYCSFENETGFVYYDETIEDETAENAIISDWLKRATCEQALYLLNLGKDPSQSDKKTTLGIVSTEGTTFDKSFRADILCVSCRRILENNGGEIVPEATAESGVSGGYFTK